MHSAEHAPAVAIETMGCKLNASDSDALARQFMAAGFRMAAPGQPADVYVLNTCTVTHLADREARRRLRLARRVNPRAVVVATGCYAERPDVSGCGADIVARRADRPCLPEMVMDALGDAQPRGVPPSAEGQRLLRTRAMVKVQEGCDQVCAFCIVPRVRGRERCVPVEHVLAEVRARVAEGHREVVLTGTQIGSYYDGASGARIEDLARRILAETAIPRLRISSVQPQDIRPGLIALWRDPRLCRHLHVPLQSGCDATLERMRRRYRTTLYAEAVARLREAVPDIAVTTDVMVGFPGETEAEFEASYGFCARMDFAMTHVFPYSARPGTTAAHLGGHVPDADRRARMARMLALARESARAYRARFLGRTEGVLWELRPEEPLRPAGAPVWSGVTDTYIRVAARSDVVLSNRIGPAMLIADSGDGLEGRVVENVALS